MYQSQWAPKSDEEEKASSLSAVAAPFSPAAPPPDTSSNDYFAQTGASQDDLFDGATPVDDAMRVRSEDDLFSDEFTPVQQPIVEQEIPQRTRGRGEGSKSRGRGRARGAQGPREITTSNTLRNAAGVDGQREHAQPDPTAPGVAPKGPRKEGGTTSVRGDRQATGGIAKPKLTEEELAEKMARIQVKNASLTAAHARAQADAASFAHREEQAKTISVQRQREERRDRQQMMGERERNRMRKLKAMEGREWDAEKNEEDFQRGGRFDKKGGFAGDKEDYTDGREYLLKDARGGSRGARTAGHGETRQREQRPPKQEEFPALPALDRAAVGVNHDAVRSWADQVESSTAP